MLFAHTFLTRFPNETPCFIAVMMCPYKRDFIFFLGVLKCLCEISCIFGPLRALRMRFHACLALMRFLDGFMLFLLPNFRFGGELNVN
jgi:hypothetical protein